MFVIDLNNEIVNEDMNSIYSYLGEKDSLKNSSIYITGASGMIASYLVGYFIWLNEMHNYGINILAGIRNEKKAKDRFGEYINRPYFHVIPNDVNSNVPSDVIKDVDYIIHAASFASPQYYGKWPVETMLSNIVGTNELLKYAREDRNLKSFLFFSSGAVYGTISNVKSIKEVDLGTIDILNMGNSYAEAKRCGETLCRAYYEEYSIPTNSVRVHHTYGPTLDIDNDKRMFSEFVNNVINSHNIVLTSDGSAKRAFCYISDAVAAYLTILLNGSYGNSYNQGNKNQYLSVKELAETLISLYPEKKLNVEYQTRNDAGYKLSPESRLIPLDTSKLEQLGWNPSISARDGFKRTIDAILINRKLHND